MTRTRLYRHGKLEAEGFPIEEVSDHIAEPDSVVWFDLCAPEREDLQAITEELSLHELAVEDVLQHNLRPKLDRYEGFLFLNAYAVTYDEKSGRLETIEASAFITKNALVTVRKDERFRIDEVVKRWDATPGLAEHGVLFLVYGLLDYVVDGHLDVVQEMDEQVEALEDTLFSETMPTRDEQRRTFEMRKSLVTFRRVVLPMREVVDSFFRGDAIVREGPMLPYYQDVYDHVLRATEWTESLRDLLGNIREAHLSMQSNKLNLIMKRVTSWAAIIAVPTMITGFYGQNVPYPGYGQSWGFWASTLLTVGVSILLYRAFRKRDWM
ncbi:magnesium transporter CorA family protein [Streptosporangiaceae bacterium NEAU-GS5]|nr:magnesium transporter CorA family protein [Streptosporangiaceae bacterium NEAU-GS5]